MCNQTERDYYSTMKDTEGNTENGKGAIVKEITVKQFSEWRKYKFHI